MREVLTTRNGSGANHVLPVKHPCPVDAFTVGRAPQRDGGELHAAVGAVAAFL